MPKLLPYSRWLELVDVTRRGIPKHGQPGSVVCDHILEQAINLATRDRSKSSKPRANLALLNELGSELMNDGVAAGLAFNSTERIDPGITLFKHLAMPRTVALFQSVASLLPPASKRTARHKSDWFDDPARAAALDALEAKADSCELLRQGIFHFAFRIIVASPAAFFDDPNDLGFSHPAFTASDVSQSQSPTNTPPPSSKFHVRTFRVSSAP
ncbi:MAG: hypothetical protein HEQ23_08315 [Tepidisphaera sp.]